MNITKILNEYPRFVLPEGLTVYHGTNCRGDFSAVDGPGWFAHTRTTAARWAGWGSVPFNRKEGVRRVISYQVKQPVYLLDTNDPVRWAKMVLVLCGDENMGLGVIAQCLREKQQIGWHSSVEIMLCHPEQYLRYIGEQPVQKPKPYGAV